MRANPTIGLDEEEAREVLASERVSAALQAYDEAMVDAEPAV